LAKEANIMPASFVFQKANNGRFFFNLRAANHQTVLTSEMYSSKAACMKGIAAVKENARKKSQFERRVSKSGKPYFVLLAANKEPVGSSEMYSSRSAMENGIKAVQHAAAKAVVVEKI
jgi:uncharacterized protein YegP (UPF0339 family)